MYTIAGLSKGHCVQSDHIFYWRFNEYFLTFHHLDNLEVNLKTGNLYTEAIYSILIKMLPLTVQRVHNEVVVF